MAVTDFVARRRIGGGGDGVSGWHCFKASAVAVLS